MGETLGERSIAETKRLVDVDSLAVDTGIVPEWEPFLAAPRQPETQARIQKLFERGLHQPGDVQTGPERTPEANTGSR